MAVLRRISELLGTVFGGHRAEVRRIALGSGHSPIYKLPPELFLLIADYLSVEEGASLSLTCYSLYSCLGKQCLESLKEAEHLIMNRFLHFLERDLPTHIVCPHCNQLHSVFFAENHHLPSKTDVETSKPWLACRLADFNGGLESGLYIGFSSTIFRMAMKAHRQGHESTKLLSLLSYGTKTIFNWGFVEQRTATVRIQDGSLLVREQRVFMVPFSHKVPVPWCGSMAICSHIFFVTMSDLYLYGIQVPLANEIEGYENRQGLIHCEHCHTEFRIDFKSYGKAGNAMFLTRWMDVGEGRDISDYKFRSRLRWIEETSWKKIAFRRGSICAAFEQMAESEFKFDSLLTQQNEKDLGTESPWPWPEGIEISGTGVTQYYVVSHGRFLFC